MYSYERKKVVYLVRKALPVTEAHSMGDWIGSLSVILVSIGWRRSEAGLGDWSYGQALGWLWLLLLSHPTNSVHLLSAGVSSETLRS